MRKLYFATFLLLLFGTSLAQVPVGVKYLDLPKSVSYEQLISGLVAQGYVVDYTSDYVIKTTYKELMCDETYVVNMRIYVNKLDDHYRISARCRVRKEKRDRELYYYDGKRSWQACAFLKLEDLYKIFGGEWR